MIRGTVKLLINNVVYNSRLDFGCLMGIHYQLDGKTIPDIIEGVFDDNIEIIHEVLIQSLLRCDENLSRKQALENILSVDKELAKTYACYLISISFPKNSNDSINPELARFKRLKASLKKEDWSFPDMEYMWHSIFRRTDDFLNIIPINYFEQVEAHKKFNNIRNEDENIEYVDGTEYM